MTEQQTIHAAWTANDEALSAELKRLFGRNAGDARYDTARKGWSEKAIELGRRHSELGAQWHALRTVK